jgi:hypothetical protein
MAEMIFCWEHEPCIASQKLGREAGRCRSVCNTRTGSPLMRLVRASDDDRLEGTRTLNFDNGTSMYPENDGRVPRLGQHVSSWFK